MGRRGAWAEGAILLVVGLNLARPQHRDPPGGGCVAGGTPGKGWAAASAL